MWAAAVSVASSSSSPFDSYRSSAEIGASLTCYCTALLSAFELFAHESVDLLTRPQSRPPPNPISPIPTLLDTPATQWRGCRFLFFSIVSFLFYFCIYFICCVVFVFACVFLSSHGKMHLSCQKRTLCNRFSFSPMGVDLWQAVGSCQRRIWGGG